MIKNNLILISVLLLTISCSSSKKQVKSDSLKKSQNTVPVATATAVVLPVETSHKKTLTPLNKPLSEDLKKRLQDIPDTLFARIQRTACFGSCPSYTATIYRSGYTVWEGERFTEKIGTYKTIVSKEDMEKIRVTALEINYFNLESEYNSNVTDLPSTYTTLQFDSNKKIIKSRHQIPEELGDFEKFIDSILDLQKWTPVKTQSNE